MKKNRSLTRMTALLLVLVCMLGLLPTAALAADAPSSIKLEDCTHNGVHYESPSLGTCWLHQMTFDYNQKSTIGFCAEHGKGMGWSLEGQTWGNPKPITDPTVQTMMAYYYAHTTGFATFQLALRLHRFLAWKFVMECSLRSSGCLTSAFAVSRSIFSAANCCISSVMWEYVFRVVALDT